ncbi:hypothetical protein DPMN_091174 [Dreissena polymorpha]|uniref:Uncharacterized protein n=1 Tax=Dreissena polymorpha TaxID=45954 RepID=A0A9D4KZX8_DREPO|nr:hypothetical protein DPMN_091174 [Dreissena polymorpha]
MLRVQESSTTPLELPQHFHESPWVRQTIADFEACPAAAYKDVRGILIAMIALRIASRTGEFVHLQVRNITVY